MIEKEEVAELKKTVRDLERRVKRLTKRLLEKKKYERAMLINSGATPQYMASIDEKDQLAMEG